MKHLPGKLLNLNPRNYHLICEGVTGGGHIPPGGKMSSEVLFPVLVLFIFAVF